MFCEPKEPFPKIDRKKSFFRYRITLQFLMYEKISFFIINKYYPLSDAKNFLKINNDKFKVTVLWEIFIVFFILTQLKFLLNN